MQGQSTTSRSLHAVFARAIGWAGPLQLIVLAIWLAVPHPVGARAVPLVAITLAPLPMYLLLLARRPMLTRTATNAATACGVLQMAGMVWAGGGLTSGFELLPLWFVPMTVCLLPRTDVLIELGAVIVATALAAVIESHTSTTSLEDPMWAFGVVGVATLLFNTALARYVYGQLQAISDRFRRRSVQDPLTELANRAALATYVAGQCEEGWCGTACVIDIDGFKFINDSLGHRAGDALLQRLAERLRTHAREADLLARTGGDEFVLIARGVCNAADAQSLASRLLEVCDQPFTLDGLEASVSVTVGAALVDEVASLEESMGNADLALYAAKSSQPGTARLFEQSMRKQAVSRLNVEHHLRRALSRGELRVVYQPIVSVPTGAIAGFEALLRWRSAELGDVSPADFIPIAERTALIVPIGRFVLAEAVRQLALWRQHGHDISLSVNLSPGQLADEQLPDLIGELLARHQISPDRLTLELTETALMERVSSQPLELLELVRDLGVHLALDDFGTGYSSLSRLSRLELTAVKIDRAFVAQMLKDAPTAAIVRAVLAMAEPMGVAVIAEGVENQDQLAHLAELGCQFAQGYLFAPPTEAGATLGLLEAEPGLFSRRCLTKLPGRVRGVPAVLITGASRGIGRATSLRLAYKGWHVIATVRRPGDGERLVADAPPDRIKTLELDVTDTGQVDQLASKLPERLDALVNNAGIVVPGPMESLSARDVRQQFDVNVVGPVAVTNAVLPRLRASQGRIVFVSSMSGRVSTPMTGAYNASKFALEAIADAWRLELRPWGIYVSLVEPAMTDTTCGAPRRNSRTPPSGRWIRSTAGSMTGTSTVCARRSHAPSGWPSRSTRWQHRSNARSRRAGRRRATSSVSTPKPRPRSWPSYPSA